MTVYKAPPLGIMPRYVWDDLRLKALVAAMRRMQDNGYPIPVEWVEEYNELLIRQAKAKETIKNQ
jgi:hypothetical protein